MLTLWRDIFIHHATRNKTYLEKSKPSELGSAHNRVLSLPTLKNNEYVKKLKRGPLPVVKVRSALMVGGRASNQKLAFREW